jgi:hypothetical protein
MINRLPQPSLLAFAAHKAPHLIHLGGLHLVDDDLHLLNINTLEKSFIDVL